MGGGSVEKVNGAREYVCVRACVVCMTEGAQEMVIRLNRTGQVSSFGQLISAGISRPFISNFITVNGTLMNFVMMNHFCRL